MERTEGYNPTEPLGISACIFLHFEDRRTAVGPVAGKPAFIRRADFRFWPHGAGSFRLIIFRLVRSSLFIISARGDLPAIFGGSTSFFRRVNRHFKSLHRLIFCLGGTLVEYPTSVMSLPQP